MRKVVALVVILVFCCSFTVWGATIKLKDGSELQGEIVEKGKTTVKLKIEGGLELEIDGDKIVSVDGEKYVVDVRAAYDDELRKIDDSKADDQYRIADWCRGRGLDAESKMHLRKAIEINPKHEGANLALGKVYVEQEGAWMDRADARAKGYTVGKGSGKWVTEKEAMAERGLQEYKGYMLSDAEIKAMKAREIKRYKSLYYTHTVCDLRDEIRKMDFLNKCNLDKKQLEEIFPILLEAENKRQFFQDQIHVINARVELAYNRLKEEGIKGVFNTYDRPPGVEEAAGSAEYEVIDVRKGFVDQMTPFVEQMMKTLAQMKGARTQKGSALFVMDHGYCMDCHGDMHGNLECASCHKGGRKIEGHPAELAAIKEIRNMPGDQWAAQKEKIISKWCRPVPAVDAGGKPLPKMEIKRREMMERESIEKLLVETRDYPATDFERSKEMLAAKLASRDATQRTRVELDVLGERRHKLSHNPKVMSMMACCFFDGTLFNYVSDKLGLSKKKETLLASAGRGTGLVEKQTVVSGKAAFEQYCCFCHPLERVMVRVRMGAMGADMWNMGVKKRLRYFKGDWTDEEMDQRISTIVDYLLELESKYVKKDDKKEEF